MLFAWAWAAERATMAMGRVASTAWSPSAAEVANVCRASRILVPASMVEAPTAERPGTAEATSPAPIVTMPASPSVSTQASRTVATVTYEDTTLEPARAVASDTA